MEYEIETDECKECGRNIMRWLKPRYFMMICLLAITPLVFANPVQSYEAEVRALAMKLASQLEAAGQRSGTVLDFTDLQGQRTELGRFLAQEFSDQLVSANKKISFVDRANLQHLLRENKLAIEGLVDPTSSRKLGNLIGIDTIIFGTTTPIGDKIRLSVRAVAVETGKIVTSQAVTLPATGGLADLYNRGVANDPAEAGSATPGGASKPSDIRTRLRADSFKLTVNRLAVPRSGYSSAMGGFTAATVNFTIENRSGIGMGIALRTGGTSVGPCSQEWDVSGIARIDDGNIRQLQSAPNPGRNLRWLPAGGSVSATITMNQCYTPAFQGTQNVPVNVTIVLGTDKELLVLPLSAGRVAVHFFQ